MTTDLTLHQKLAIHQDIQNLLWVRALALNPYPGNLNVGTVVVDGDGVYVTYHYSDMEPADQRDIYAVEDFFADDYEARVAARRAAVRQHAIDIMLVAHDTAVLEAG